MSRSAIIIAFALCLSACGGDGGATPPATTKPIGSPTGPTTSFTVSGTISQSGPQLLTTARRIQSVRKTALTFSSIVVKGTLYTGDAGAYQLTNQTTIPVPSNGVYTASVTFSDVPVHNNQWVVLQFIGQAADGTQVSIGNLAGLVNVTSASTDSSTLTVATTQTFQVFFDLLRGGFLGTWDLDNNPTLATELATIISNDGGTPDANTQLFGQAERQRLYKAIAPKFERDLNVSTSVAGEITVTPDYTNTSEVDLAANLSTTPLSIQPGYILQNVPSTIGGLNQMVVSQGGAPSSTYTPVIKVLYAQNFVTPSGGEQIPAVYGGNLLLGATTTVSPFQSGLIHVPGRAQGTSSATVPSAASGVSVTLNDPQGFAFPNDAGFTLQLHPRVNELLSNAQLGGLSGWPVFSVPSPYNASNNTITANTFTPYGLSQGDIQLCVPNSVTCLPLTVASANVLRPFFDNAVNLAYFNYSPGGVATGITQGSSVYSITTSGAGTATLTTTTPTAIAAGQTVYMQYSAGGATLSWTMTAYDSAGKSYPGTIINAAGNQVVFQFSSVLIPIKTTQIVFTFSSPSATTITWSPNYNAGTYQW